MPQHLNKPNPNHLSKNHSVRTDMYQRSFVYQAVSPKISVDPSERLRHPSDRPPTRLGAGTERPVKTSAQKAHRPHRGLHLQPPGLARCSGNTRKSIAGWSNGESGRPEERLGCSRRSLRKATLQWPPLNPGCTRRPRRERATEKGQRREGNRGTILYSHNRGSLTRMYTYLRRSRICEHTHTHTHTNIHTHTPV